MTTQVRTCIQCGCTDERACVVESTARKYTPCHWVGPQHCSGCFLPIDEGGRCPEHMPSHPDVAAHFTQVTEATCPICRLVPREYDPAKQEDAHA